MCVDWQLVLIVCRRVRCMRQVFPAGVILADGDFSELESVIIGAPLDMTNKYLRAVAYYEVCGLFILLVHVTRSATLDKST